MDSLLFKGKKIGFIGAGNMSQAIVSSLLASKLVEPNQIVVSNRSEKKLDRFVGQFAVTRASSNEELVDSCDIVILSVKPQDCVEAIEPISSSFRSEQIFISLAAGITIEKLKKLVPNTKRVVRVIPNTPVSMQAGVVGYCTNEDDSSLDTVLEALFSASGIVFKVNEGEDFEAFTVANSSGIGFVFELMTYWQEWLEEYSFSPDQARAMTVQTFLGAAKLASEKPNTSIEELQNKVTSKKGVTSAGLDSMRELEIERLLRYSFEKAVLRDRELGKNSL